MADILLITDSELTKDSPLGGNVDPDKYRLFIKEAQVFTLEPILGTKLFDKIITDFNADTLAGVYSTIHTEYLKPILINSAAAEYIIMSLAEVRNAGVLRFTPEGTTPATKEEIDFLANKLKAKADVYIERLQRYLRDQQANITEYTYNQDNNYDIDPDKRVQTFGGWRLNGRDFSSTNAMREIYRDIINDEGA